MKIETFIASELPQMKSKREREKVSKNPVGFTGIIPMTNTRQCFHSVPELWETCASIHLICSCLRQKGVKDWYSKYKPESRKKQQRKRNWEQMWHAHNLLPQNTMVNGIFVFMLIFFSWLTRSFLMKEYNVSANVRQFDTILMTNVIRFSYKKEKKKRCSCHTRLPMLSIELCGRAGGHVCARVSLSYAFIKSIVKRFPIEWTHHCQWKQKTDGDIHFNKNTQQNRIVQHLNIYFGVKWRKKIYMCQPASRLITLILS